MKKAVYFSGIFLLVGFNAIAQTDVTNQSILYINSGTDTFYINGGFTNASTASFTNNGRFYLKENFINNQPSMAVGTGELYLNGTANQSITTTSGSPFYKLTINKPSGLTTLSSVITVNQTLNLTAGNISIANYDLTIANSGTISNANAASYIIATGTGAVNQQVAAAGSKLFPVGTSAAYTPATIALTAGSATDLFSMRMLTSFYSQGTTGTPLISNAVNATWMIAETVAGGSDASITCQWPLSLELPSFDRDFSRVAHYASGAWEYGFVNIPASGSNPYTVTRSGLTAFSPYGVSMFMAVLPVSLLKISGKNNGNENLIHWSTITETNSDYFSIEASLNGTDFTEAGRVKATGNSNGLHNYNFVHREIGNNSFYYRIKQVDIDGRATYSNVVRIEVVGFRLAALYPNPVKNKTTISFSLKNTSLVVAHITNASGLLVYKYSEQYDKGNRFMNLDLSMLPAGNYMLRLTDDRGNKQTFRFSKTN